MTGPGVRRGLCGREEGAWDGQPSPGWLLGLTGGLAESLGWPVQPEESLFRGEAGGGYWRVLPKVILNTEESQELVGGSYPGTGSEDL